MHRTRTAYAGAWIVASNSYWSGRLFCYPLQSPYHMPDSKGIGGIAASNSVRIVSGNVFDCITSKQGKKHEYDLH
jgi:hypothetical protein